MLAIPSINAQVAVEIPLTSIYGSNAIPGDNPLDSPELSGYNPTDPTLIYAALDGNVLIVSNESVDYVDVVVTDIQTNLVVIDTQITAELEQALPAGDYQIEISTMSLVLHGFFEVE